MTSTLIQLAHSKLLSEARSASILAGKMPPLSEILLDLVVTSLDAHAVAIGDPKTSWAERRLSHQNLANSFLLALLLEGTFGSEKRGGANTPT